MRWLALAVMLLASQVQAQSMDSRTMCPLASALTKLARAVDVYVGENSMASAMRGEELVRAAADRDPSLLEPFSKFRVTARVEGRNSSVLVCTADGRRTLIEDAGCTARSDAQRWDDGSYPCGFTLDLAAVCTNPPPSSINLCR